MAGFFIACTFGPVLTFRPQVNKNLKLITLPLPGSGSALAALCPAAPDLTGQTNNPMQATVRTRQPYPRPAPTIRCMLGILLWSCGLPLLAMDTLPDALQPGALRPELQPRTPPQPPALDALEIPPLVERPLSAEAGERIAVSRFQLVDARDLPEYGIFLADLEQLLEASRLEQPSGFTIGQLEAVTNRITNHYRSRGLILAKAVLPVQTVTNGVVAIQVIEGHLGRVLAEGNQLYARDTLARPFNDLKGQPVSQQQAESALLILTDFPGLAAFGMFQPGQRVGETDLMIRVPNEERFNFNLRLDNHGS
jgi:hemolysin activation/secretion protein